MPIAFVLQDEKSEDKKKPKSSKKKKSSAIKRKAPRTSPRQQAKRAKLDAGLYGTVNLRVVSIKDFLGICVLAIHLNKQINLRNVRHKKIHLK